MIYHLKTLCLGKTWHLKNFQLFSQLELWWHIGERTIESWLQLNHDYESSVFRCTVEENTRGVETKVDDSSQIGGEGECQRIWFEKY